MCPPSPCCLSSKISSRARAAVFRGGSLQMSGRPKRKAGAAPAAEPAAKKAKKSSAKAPKAKAQAKAKAEPKAKKAAAAKPKAEAKKGSSKAAAAGSKKGGSSKGGRRGAKAEAKGDEKAFKISVHRNEEGVALSHCVLYVKDAHAAAKWYEVRDRSL